MLCFVFSGLIVALDLLFKQWIAVTLAQGGERILIPGVIGLTYVENTGAALGLFPNSRWPLAIIAFLCVMLIIAVLLRYDGEFWGRLGIAAVLGGAAGNLVDRVFRGYVIDMFELKFMNFWIFNIADIFITLGGILFFIYFVVLSSKPEKNEEEGEQNPKAQPVLRPLPRKGTKNTSAVPPASTHVRSAQNPVQPPVRPTQNPVQPPVRHVQNPVQPPVRPTQNPAQPQFRAPDAAPSANFQNPSEFESVDYSDIPEGLSTTRILEEFDLERLLSEYGLDDES